MIKNIVIVSDEHCGCKLGLCGERVKLDEAGFYTPSRFQKEVFKHWQYFWREYVPIATKNEPYVVINNGDAIDGVHHGATTQISNNISDQLKIAKSILLPVVENKKCKGLYMIRGTEVHVGKSGEDEEKLAKTLGAISINDGRTKNDDDKQYSRYEIWLRFGANERFLLHATHHVGTTGSANYESTAIYKELVEAYNECGRWGDEPPDVIVRSHRHRNFECKVPSEKGNAIALCTGGLAVKDTARLQGVDGAQCRTRDKRIGDTRGG